MEKKKRGGAGKGQGRHKLARPEMKKVHVVIYQPLEEVNKKGGMVEVKAKLNEYFNSIENKLD